MVKFVSSAVVGIESEEESIQNRDADEVRKIEQFVDSIDSENLIISDKISEMIQDSYFERHNINESKIQSYNKFVSDDLPNIYTSGLKMVVKFGKQYHFFIPKSVTC